LLKDYLFWADFVGFTNCFCAALFHFGVGRTAALKMRQLKYQALINGAKRSHPIAIPSTSTIHFRCG
jgi:hypothetical protein